MNGYEIIYMIRVGSIVWTVLYVRIFSDSGYSPCYNDE